MTAQDALTFHRPPREYPPTVPSERLRIAAPPVQPPPPHTSIIQLLFPVVGGVSMVGFALVYGNTLFLYIAGAMIMLLLLFSLGMRWSQKRAVRKRAADEARRYGKYLREQDTELAEAGELQRGALARLYPDPGRLWTLLVKRANVWERRPDHKDFMHVRLGTGAVALDRPVELDLGLNPLAEYQAHSLQEARKLVERRTTLRGEPVVVDLDGIGVLAVTGDRERARSWARTLMNQLSAWRAPHDLRLLTAFEPDDAEAWEWGKWLPHQRVDPNVPGRFLFARSMGELDSLLEPELRPRLEQLRRIAESNVIDRDVRLVAPELIVILDGYRPDHPANELPAFRELLTRARQLKAVLILLTDARELEPSHIDARLTVPERTSGTWELWGQDAPSIPEVFLDQVDLGSAEATARTLTPLRLAEGGDGERGLSMNVRLVDLLGLPSADALDAERAWRPRPRAGTLRAPIGRSAEGEILELDLKQAAEGGMGPHGVLVGATGSGKSELLRSLVAGLAATHGPEQLAFVLVDYKGGAAFAELSRLPHVAGLITNLQRDLSLVDRMHAALIGEQERRQTMLREAGNLDDIVAYQARLEADPSMPPMPDLLVIVDEFAELLAARPEFIDLFVALGRVGRSLGIHLLLSSQRLDEGRLRGLESHLRYRLCLRTYSAVESKLVLGTPDAYLLPSMPGLGYLKVDTEKYVQFRAALASGPHLGPTVSEARPAPVQVFEPQPGMEHLPVAEPETLTGGPSELQVLVDRLTGDRPPVHQVWVAPLPEAEPLDAVLTDSPWWHGGERAEGVRAVIGRLDRPSEQRTEPYELDLAGAGGHAAVVGSPRTGKSTLLRTLAASLIWRHTPAQVQIYGIDLGGGLLGALEGAPHVGGMTGKLQREAVTRVVRQLRTEVEDREQAFREAGLESMTEARNAGAFPDIFLFVDGWEAFKREFEMLDREVEELAATGLSFGIHVVVAANRWAEIRPALLDNLGTRFELKLHDAIDSLVSRQAAASLPAEVPGRGLTSEGLHFQAALPRVDGRAEDEGTAAALGELVSEAAEHWREPGAPPIRLLPRELDPRQLPAAVGARGRALRGRGAGPGPGLDPAVRAGAALPGVRRQPDRQVVAPAWPRPRPGRGARAGGAAARGRRRAALADRSRARPARDGLRRVAARRPAGGRAAARDRGRADGPGRRLAARRPLVDRPALRRAVRRLRPRRRAHRRAAGAAARRAGRRRGRRPARGAGAPRGWQRARRLRVRLRPPARARVARRPAQRRPGGGAAARRHQGAAAARGPRAVRAPRRAPRPHPDCILTADTRAGCGRRKPHGPREILVNTCAVTIAGPDRRVDLVVSTETPIADLIPTFVELSLDEAPVGNGRAPVWTVAPPGQQPLPLDRTLGECGVADGAVLTLTEIRSQAAAPPKPAEVVRRPAEVSRGTPRERTQAALPQELGGGERLSLAMKAFFGYEPEPPITESPEPPAQNHREVLTKPEQRSASERFKASWRESEYEARLDRMIAQPRLTRCATIAVVSPKGGVGKTTMTVLLGSLLARVRRDRIVAVDTNPDYGSLGRTLTPDHQVFVDDLSDVLEQPDLSVTALDRHLGRAFDGLMVLPAPTDPSRMAQLNEDSYARVISRLQTMVGVLVLDCGTGLQEPAARAAQAAADQIVLISDAHPATASLVAEAAELLRTVGPPMTLVVNKMPRKREARLDLDGMERLVPDAQGLITLDEDLRSATRVATGDYSWDDAPSQWRRAIRELAVSLQAGWPALGITN